MKRLFIMDCGWKDGAMTPVVCINPEIIEASDAQAAGVEGCLSIPDVPVEVTRPERVVLRWHDLNGAAQEKTLEGFEARCAQHELDHLNGVVIFDHLTGAHRQEIEAVYLERHA